MKIIIDLVLDNKLASAFVILSLTIVIWALMYNLFFNRKKYDLPPENTRDETKKKSNAYAEYTGEGEDNPSCGDPYDPLCPRFRYPNICRDGKPTEEDVDRKYRSKDFF